MKRLISLVASIVLLIFSCAFSFQQDDLSYGKGKGQNAKIQQTSDLSNLLASVNTLYEAKGRGSDKIPDSVYKSATLELSISDNISVSNTPSGNGDSTSATRSLRRSIQQTHYITPNAILLRAVGTIYSSNSGSGYVSGSNYGIGGYSTGGTSYSYSYSSSTYYDIDIELYMSAEKEMMKIHHFTVFTSSSRTQQGETKSSKESLVFPGEYLEKWIEIDDSSDLGGVANSLGELEDTNLDIINYFCQYFVDNQETKFSSNGKHYSLRLANWDDFTKNIPVDLMDKSNGGLFTIDLSDAESPGFEIEIKGDDYAWRGEASFSNIDNTVVNLDPSVYPLKMSQIDIDSYVVREENK